MVYTAWCTIMAFSVVPLGLLLLAVLCSGAKFGYEDGDENGPSNWGNLDPTCNGKRQSPINIDTSEVKNTCFDTPLKLCGIDNVILMTATNNGHSIQLECDKSKKATVSGGPLGNSEYIFEQMHCHWGKDNSEGSEHLINNGSFPMECHCVFRNEKYSSMSEAIEHTDGLAILGSLYKISDKPNPSFKGIVDAIPNIKNANTMTKVKVPLKNFLIKCAQYYTYKGSLTTPPCSEAGTWIVFKESQTISSDQVAAFRTIRDTEDNLLTHNFRPIQPLNEREVWQNCAKAESYSFLSLLALLNLFI